MLKHHKAELLLRLERVFDIGCAEISQRELKRWFERDRITSAIWEGIYEEWTDITEDVALLVGDGDGLFVFVWGQGLLPEGGDWSSDKLWLTDIKSRCGKNFGKPSFSL